MVLPPPAPRVSKQYIHAPMLDLGIVLCYLRAHVRHWFPTALVNYSLTNPVFCAIYKVLQSLTICGNQTTLFCGQWEPLRNGSDRRLKTVYQQRPGANTGGRFPVP